MITREFREGICQTQGDPQHGFAEGESGFEGIFHDKTQDGMYVVREAVDISGASAAS